jgi:hypothetical protein
MTSSNTSAWTGMVPVDDTALSGTDTGGPGPPVVCLNGSYASQRSWRPVIADLGTAVLEVKSGRLDHDSYPTQLIDQMIANRALDDVKALANTGPEKPRSTIGAPRSQRLGNGPSKVGEKKAATRVSAGDGLDCVARPKGLEPLTF